MAEQLKLLGVMCLPAKKAAAEALFAAFDGWIPSQLKKALELEQGAVVKFTAWFPTVPISEHVTSLLKL